jgi:hypothetical protein
MALKESDLSSALKTIFDEMSSSASGTPKNNQWYADQMSTAITNQIKSAGIPVGKVIVEVAGAATGTPNAAEINVE